MKNIFYENMDGILKIIVTAPIIYAIIIIYIRLFGKQTTPQMNSFDWIVTVAIGSLVSSMVILKNVPIFTGALAILMIMLMQYILTWAMVRSKYLRETVRATPQLLLFEGKFIDKNMKAERIVKTEIYAAIRESGLPKINDDYAVVLETDARFSVIGIDKKNTTFSLADVQGFPDGLKKDLKKAQDSGTFPRD